MLSSKTREIKELITLPQIDYSYSPPFIYREVLAYDASRWEFASRQRLNGGNMKQVLARPWPGPDERIPGIFICVIFSYLPGGRVGAH